MEPVYFTSDLQRVYPPNAGVGLYGPFQLTGDTLVLDIDEIGDVLDTRNGRGSAPATWRFHLRRKSSDYDPGGFIKRHSVTVPKLADSSQGHPEPAP
jgi:hypothetical protein